MTHASQLRPDDAAPTKHSRRTFLIGTAVAGIAIPAATMLVAPSANAKVLPKKPQPTPPPDAYFIGLGDVASICPDGTANIQVSLQEGEDGQSGTLIFSDGPANLRITGVAGTGNKGSQPQLISKDQPSEGSVGFFWGTYKPVSKGASGMFYLAVTPGGLADCRDGWYSLSLWGGKYSGYCNSGQLIDGEILGSGAAAPPPIITERGN